MDKETKKRKMIELRKQRYTLEEIGRMFGISKQRVAQLVGKTVRGEGQTKNKKSA